MMNSHLPKISVVIATYNGEKYILEQLNSIIDQTVKADEIIICDDCSNDFTVKTIEDGINIKNENIEILKHNVNHGVKKTFEELLDKASGEVVFFADQDDVWYKNKIELFMEAFSKNTSSGVVLSNADIVDENCNRLGTTLWDNINFAFGKNSLLKEMLKRNIFTGMSMAVRKKWVEDLPEFSSHMLHDEFVGWCATFENKAIFINQTTAAYRQHANNVVGVKKHRDFVSWNDMKHHVLMSNIRYRDKFNDLHSIVTANNTREYIKEARNFYEDRCELQSLNLYKAIGIIIRNVRKGNYSRYCSSSDYGLLKDCLCLL